MTTIMMKIQTMPLKEMDASLLALSIQHKVAQFASPIEQVQVDEALRLAAYLHRYQTRTNRGAMPRTHYIEHPLRNAERLLRYGVKNVALIIAVILHDTVEDGYVEMCELQGLSRHEASTGMAVAYIAGHFGATVAAIVLGLTNSPYPKGTSKADKRGLYALHVQDAVTDNPLVWLGKFVDWVDNAAGLHHNDVEGNEAMIKHLALKYTPLVEIFEGTMTDDIMNLVSDRGFEQIREHLDSGASSLKVLLSDPYEGTVLL